MKYFGGNMKNVLNTIIATLIIIFLAVNFSNSQVPEFTVTNSEDPAPGYLRFTWTPSNDFFLVDNAGYRIYNTEVTGITNYFLPLKNGNWAHPHFNSYLIFNEELQQVDSIPNPMANGEFTYLLNWHDFIQLSNGHYLMLLDYSRVTDLSQIVEGGKVNANVAHNFIVETDHNGTIYWTWDTYDHFEILDVTEDIDLTQQSIDLTHINSLFEDTDGNIIISTRHYDEISKISKATGEFIWRFGGSKCKNNQFTFENDDQNGFKGFSHQHSALLLENGNILLYDNGNLKNIPVSRAVEYKLNFNTKVATKIWEHQRSSDFYQSSMGNVQRLSNGNTLINWGRNSISEVRPNNTVAFNLVYSESLNMVVYRAHRVITKMDYSKNYLSNTTNYSYNTPDNTGISVKVDYLSGTGQTSVETHYYPAFNANFLDSSFTSLYSIRWFLNTAKIDSLNGKIKFDISKLGSVDDPSKLLIYSREKEGIGYFKELTTTYNSSTNDISANFYGGGEFIIGESNLDIPELLYPNLYEIVDVIGELKWQKIPGAKYYQVQISDAVSFSNLIVNEIILQNNFYKYDSLSFSKKYYWRIRALSSKDTSDWSNSRIFQTKLSKPSLVSPLNNINNFKIEESLKWSSVTFAKNYRLQVSKSKFFEEILYDIPGIELTECKLEQLINNTYYYWRVKAFDGDNQSEWSEVWGFKTNIKAPIIDYPQNHSKNIPVNFLARWNTVNGAQKYQILLSLNNRFEESETETFNADINQIYFENLKHFNIYFWKIRAINNLDTSSWSEVYDFKTRLETPIQLKPENLFSNIPVKCVFSWTESNPVYMYHIQISTISDFSMGLIEKDSLSEPQYLSEYLKHSQKYFWRIKSLFDDSESDWSEIWNFTTIKQVEIPTPKLISPKDKSETYVKGQLQWSPVQEANAYKLQISDNISFSNLVKDTTIAGKQIYNFFKLTAGKAYYWRVKSMSIDDSSKWSAIWSFNVSNKELPVHLIAPKNDQMQVGINGMFEWEIIPGAINYQIQLSKSNLFDNKIIDKKVNVNNLNFSDLELNHTYFWRVRFFREYDSSGWSNVWSFNTVTNSILSFPELITPIMGEKAVTKKPVFKWSNVPGALNYIISVSTDETFNEIIFKTETNSTELSYSNFENNITYYWRVAASNDTAKSFWSSTFNFTTELAQPSITRPKQNEENVEALLEVLWESKEDISYYHLQIAYDFEFKNIIYDISSIYELKQIIDLDDNTVYYCRVRAVTDDNFSVWSEIIKFKTHDPNSINSDLINTISVYPNPVSASLSISQIPEEAFYYEIFNEFGLKVNFGILRKEINISYLPSGIYFLKLNNSAKPIKFIKL